MALPSGYTQLEYIQATGTQYINTGVTTEGKTIRYEGELMFTEQVSQAFGANSGYYFGLKTNGNYSVSADTGIASSTSAFDTISFEANVSSGTVKIMVNGVPYTYSRTPSGNYPIYLFGCGLSNGVSDLCRCRLKRFKIYKAGVLFRDFVAARRNSDGALGAYDQQNGVFYSNTGSGVFTAGPVYDKTAPVGDHNTLIDGTAYAVTDGKALVGGTVYDVAEGKTLIGGTAYDISFGEIVPISIKAYTEGTANETYGYVEIDGVRYTGSQAATIGVKAGTEMVCYAMPHYGMYGGYVYIDDVKVAEGKPVTYTYTINSPIEVQISGLTVTCIWIYT